MKTRSMRGFTLTELLVAVAVGSIIMMGIYSVFMNSLNIFQGQQEVGQVQFNGKAVTGYLRERVANAGGGVPAGIPIPAVGFINTASNISPRYLLGTDAFQFRVFGNVGDPMSVSDYNNPAANCSLELPNYVDPEPSPVSNTSVGNLLLFWKEGIDNYAMAEIASVTPTGGGGVPVLKVNFPPGQSAYNTPDGLGEDYEGGHAIMIDRNSMEVVTLFVDANRVLRMATDTPPAATFNMADPSDPNNPTALPLLDNVEDFQVELGFDANDDNIVETWTFDDTGHRMADLLALKFYVLCRTQREDRFTSGVLRPDIDRWDGIEYPDAPDNVRRRMYSFSVQLRNQMQ